MGNCRDLQVRATGHRESSRGANAGEWCKKEQCWKKIQEHEYALSADLQAELISVEQPTRRSLPATGSIESPTKEDYDLINEVIAISAETWFALSRWAKETNNFQPWMRSLIFSIGRLAAKRQNPSIKQATQAMKAYREAIKKGFNI